MCADTTNDLITTRVGNTYSAIAKSIRKHTNYRQNSAVLPAVGGNPLT